MAKRKLSSEQRDELRKAMTEAVKAGKPTAEILKEAAEKYGITTITARWYLKSIDGAPKARRGRPPGRPAGKRRGRPPGRPARRRGPGRPPGRPRGRAAASFYGTGKEIGSLKAMERLFPRWQALLQQQAKLKKVEAKVARQLKAISKKAQALGAKIKQLVG